jgi:hypothetical protein
MTLGDLFKSQKLWTILGAIISVAGYAVETKNRNTEIERCVTKVISEHEKFNKD